MPTEEESRPKSSPASRLARACRSSLGHIRPAELFDAWLFAEAEATLAMRAWWSAAPHEKADAYATYLAALDREDRAASVLSLRLNPA
jgi:hypothetical protein